MRCSRSTFSSGVSPPQLPLITFFSHALASTDRAISLLLYQCSLYVPVLTTVAPCHTGLSGSRALEGPNSLTKAALHCSGSLSPKYTITVHSFPFQNRNSTVVGFANPGTV